jgi:DNA-binding response OmpR family regulator
LVDIAVVNTSEELADLMEEVLTSEGWSTVRGYTLDFKRGRQDLSTFLREQDPKVIVWDVAIPYEENWALYQEVRRLPVAEERQFVVTTTNVDVLNRLIGTDTAAHEIIGKPFDLEQLCTAVQRALGQR